MRRYCTTISYHFSFFFFNDPATTEIYTLSLHDALPIYPTGTYALAYDNMGRLIGTTTGYTRSEEHTSELQSRGHLVCRLLLEKKKKKSNQSRCSKYFPLCYCSAASTTPCSATSGSLCWH